MLNREKTSCKKLEIIIVEQEKQFAFGKDKEYKSLTSGTALLKITYATNRSCYFIYSVVDKKQVIGEQVWRYKTARSHSDIKASNCILQILTCDKTWAENNNVSQDKGSTTEILECTYKITDNSIYFIFSLGNQDWGKPISILSLPGIFNRTTLNQANTNVQQQNITITSTNTKIMSTIEENNKRKRSELTTDIESTQQRPSKQLRISPDISVDLSEQVINNRDVQTPMPNITIPILRPVAFNFLSTSSSQLASNQTTNINGNGIAPVPVANIPNSHPQQPLTRTPYQAHHNNNHYHPVPFYSLNLTPQVPSPSQQNSSDINNDWKSYLNF